MSCSAVQPYAMHTMGPTLQGKRITITHNNHPAASEELGKECSEGFTYGLG